MAREAFIDTVRDDEIRALEIFIDHHDTAWKRTLRHCWESGTAIQPPETAAALQRLRNRIGPSGLQRLTTGAVLDAANEIRKNRGEAQASLALRCENCDTGIAEGVLCNACRDVPRSVQVACGGAP